MKRLIACLAGICVLLAVPLTGQGQSLTVSRSANLRAAANTSSSIIERLPPGTSLTLVSAGKKGGFYHVETAAGTKGWIYQTLLHFDEVDEDPPLPPAAPGLADAVDASWEKPAPHAGALSGPPGFDPCPADGEAGGDVETNRRKNRADVPASYHALTFTALRDLPYPVANTKRSKWTADQLAEIAPFEGVAVSVEGYIVAVKKQFGGSGEETNCHFSKPQFVDTHMALVEHPGDGEKEAIVVEPTPRFYAAHPSWVFSKLRDLDDLPLPVRISGWTLLDPVHKGHLGKLRATLWEIHPITKIEVFRDGKWVEW
jgi:hypothetical protein